MRPLAHSRRNMRGVALVVVLWGLVLIAIIAGSFAAGTRTDATMAFNIAENAKARAIAEAGIQRGIQEMLLRDNSDWHPDGTPYPIAAPDGEVAVSLHDSLGRIDLNTAPEELVAALLTSFDMDEDDAAALADAIADYRDPDDLVRINGAEARDYRAAGLEHEPKNAPFEAIQELRLVLGMSEVLYRRLEPLITVHSRRPWVNLATAPMEILQALPNLGDDARDQIMERREPVEEGELETDAPPAVAPTRFGRITRPGSVFVIRAEAKSAGGGLFIREAIVGAGGNSASPYILLGWSQGARRPEPEDEADEETDETAR